MRAFAAVGAIVALTLLAACTANVPEPAAVEVKSDEAKGAVFTQASGLKITDIKIGTGAFPRAGQICVMHYTGWLYQNGKKGAKFDSSVDRGTPFEFHIGRGEVIRGWDEGVSTMKVGGKRTLIIPPDLGYGPMGRGSIPPHSFLIFEVELLAVKG